MFLSKLILLTTGILLIVTSGVSGPAFDKIDPYLQEVMTRTSPAEMINAYVVLQNRLSYDELTTMTYGLSRKARQAEVVSILKAHSAATRGPVEAFLRSQEALGMATDIRIIWAINTIAFSGTISAIEGLSELTLVERISFDPKHPVEMLLDDNGIARYNAENGIGIESLNAPQPGLTLINAPAVWDEGFEGQGVIVANIDTGTDWDHPDLRGNIWNNLGEDANGNGYTITPAGTSFDPGDINGIDDDGNGLVDDFLGWDYVGNDNDPAPFSSHGTATSGLVAGNGTNGTQTGVAPQAKLMILEPDGEASVWIAMQYAIDKGADVTTSSLSYKWYFSPQPNYPMWREMTDMELAAGIVHTNSTSNDGGLFGSAPIPYNISAPGNCPPSWLHPDQTLIGGLSSVIGCGNVNAVTDIIESSSPYGPSAWEDIQSVHPSYPFPMPVEYQDYPYETTPAIGLLKPDVSSPGNGTVSLAEGGGYASFSGTSGATPHVAGIAALLLSVDPNLEPADVSRIIQSTAIEKGTAGKDPRYGAGRVDAYEAYLEAAGGASLPPEVCAALSDGPLKLKCQANGTINIRKRMIGFTGFDGTDVEIVVDGTDSYILPIEDAPNGAGSSIEGQMAGGYAPGDHTVSIPGCGIEQIVTCLAPEADDIAMDGDLLGVPAETELLGNYPNPFNPTTTISYALATDSYVTLRIYNALGQEIATLVDDLQTAGQRSVVWNGTNNFGSRVASGVYLLRLVAGDVVQTDRIILAK